MTSSPLNPASTPTSPLYSQGVEVRHPRSFVFVSGQVGVRADGTVLEGIQAQTTQALANLEAVLAEAGLISADLAKLTVYLTDPADAELFTATLAGTLPDPPPALTVVFVAGLAAADLRVEIEGVAAR